MKIQILVHSKSGNTKNFADHIFDKLVSAGHIVNLTQLETREPVKHGSVRENQDIHFINLPQINEADLLLFGGPVWAFGPSPVIVAAIRQIGKLTGKQVIPFATMGFPLKGMGGKAAISFMAREAATRGAKVLPGSICCRMLHKLDVEFEQESNRIADLVSTPK
jgi:flavorubredoxin